MAFQIIYYYSLEIDVLLTQKEKHSNKMFQRELQFTKGLLQYENSKINICYCSCVPIKKIINNIQSHSKSNILFIFCTYFVN